VRRFKIATLEPSATGTIVDNDAATVATISDASAIEGSDVVFNFTLSNPSDKDITRNLTNVMVRLECGLHYKRSCYVPAG
jgi:hypothetical protein